MSIAYPREDDARVMGKALPGIAVFSEGPGMCEPYGMVF